MKILAINDDGYQSAGIQFLVQKLRQAGHHVTILAPDQERSCASHALTLNKPVSIRQIEADTWACSGTPADCALIGLSAAFALNPELVVSGINSGSNLGIDVIYSGTVAAARQAALHNMPAVAFSLCGYHAPLYWEEAAAWAVTHLDELAALCSADVLVNVNIPNRKVLPDKAKMTGLSGCRYKDDVAIHYEKETLAHCEFVFNGFTEERYANSDREAVNTGSVSVSRVLLEQSCP